MQPIFAVVVGSIVFHGLQDLSVDFYPFCSVHFAVGAVFDTAIIALFKPPIWILCDPETRFGLISSIITNIAEEIGFLHRFSQLRAFLVSLFFWTSFSTISVVSLLIMVGSDTM